MSVDVAAELQALLAHHASLPQAAAPTANDAEALRFYATRGFTPAWVVDGRPTRQAEEAVSLLERADQQGLASADYGAPYLRARLVTLQHGDHAASAHDLAVFDAELTLALVRYTSHLAHGRVDPRRIYPDLQVEARPVDIAALLQRGLEGDRLAASIGSAAPDLPLYAGLLRALAQYQVLAAGPALPLVPVPSGKIAPGTVFAGLPQLKERLVAFGDLDAAALKRRDADRYSGSVIDAVKRFQYRHGLADDGVLGQATVAELNRPVAERVRQIEIALERLRWLPSKPTGRFLVVNIPEFKLVAFDPMQAGAHPLLEMPVIVGRAEKTPTPIFAGDVAYLDFSPYWNVPRSIAVKELLPKLKADPGYLSREGMEVVGNGVRTELDAATLSELERGALRLRQRPGTKNALGGVKFMFPNVHDVYLHSTPSPKLFSRTRRDLSHGCIRVADPVALAQFALEGRPSWDATRIRASMSLPQPLRVNVSEPIPILIFYTTTVVDAQDRIRFLPDIYGYDATLAQTLAKRTLAVH
ncbi:MAG: L,D-transpeptidase family protein [Betaproteobacteria bacterium]|nr:L,D-transpeptidase family protein [Betaproteobacteria bacterium]